MCKSKFCLVLSGMLLVAQLVCQWFSGLCKSCLVDSNKSIKAVKAMNLKRELNLKGSRRSHFRDQGGEQERNLSWLYICVFVCLLLEYSIYDILIFILLNKSTLKREAHRRNLQRKNQISKQHNMQCCQERGLPRGDEVKKHVCAPIINLHTSRIDLYTYSSFFYK